MRGAPERGAPGPGRHGHDTHQRAARALGDPSRYRIFRYVADADGPVGVAAISGHVGLHHNAVRQHLAKLCHADLLVEEVARGRGPGRPPLQYRLAPGAAGAWGTSGSYELLSLVLLELAQKVMRGGSGRRGPFDVAGTAVAAGRAAVARVGRGDDTFDALDTLQEALAGQGCEPQRLIKGRSIELALRRCPFEVAALADPDVVCELHRGLAQGMTEAVGGPFRLLGLVARDPRDGDCRLRLSPISGQPARGTR